MQTPVEITWHNMDPARHVAERVNRRVVRLEKFFGRIVRCHVTVEAPHQRRQTGNLYEVRVDVTVPGSELSINRKPGNDFAHADVLVAVRDAFDAMERQLRRWKDEHSGRPEVREAPVQGRIARIDTVKQSGQIATTDGLLVYFHANSLVSGKLGDLKPGDPVELSVDPGEDAAGAHASMVRPIGERRFVDEPG